MKTSYNRRSKRTRKKPREAYADADLLGPLILVKPQGTRVDGSPLLGPGEVYVTRTGRRYHPSWCQIVADRWDINEGIFVSRIYDVGKREECTSCVPLTTSKLSSSVLDARHAEKQRQITESQRKVNGL